MNTSLILGFFSKYFARHFPPVWKFTNIPLDKMRNNGILFTSLF